MEETQRQYELIYILPSQLEGMDLENTKKEIEKTINRFGGSINFGKAEKRNLAYPVNKKGQGIYLVSQVSILAEKIADLSKELKLNKQILRHLITQLEIPKAEKPKRAKKPIISKKKLVIEKVKPSVPMGIRTKKGKLEEIDKKLEELIDKI